MMKKLLFVCVLVISIVQLSNIQLSAYSGDDKLECKFYHAYVTGDMSPWPGYIDLLEGKYNYNSSPEILYDIVKAYYGYVAFLIGIEDHEEANEFLDRAEKYLEKLKEQNRYRAEAKAFQGAFIAYEIGMNKAKAVYLGPRSMKNINQALELEPNNHNALIEKGNAEFHMPRMFGGSYEKAAEYFRRAVNSLEQSGNDLSCNWLYMNALAWLAQSYDKAGRIEKAENTYQKILQLEPDFQWVADELYPEFRKSHKQNY